MDKPWKVILAFTGIFLAGILVGGLVTLRWGKNMAQRLPMSEQYGPKVIGRLVTRLALAPEQQAKIKPIVDQAAQELRQLRRTTQRTSASVIERMQGEIAAQLTPEQNQGNADATRATIQKKTIRAPFAGRLGIRLVN